MNSYSFTSEIVLPTVKAMLADRGTETQVCASLRGVCEADFDVVQGVCDGTKHAENTKVFCFVPGQERDVPVFAFDVPGAGWDQGRWDIPGLSVERNGAELFLDTCIQVVLFNFSKLYQSQLGNLELSFLDAIALTESAAPRSSDGS